jgi:hypothetical protein
VRSVIARRSCSIAVLILGGLVAAACGGRTGTSLGDDRFGEGNEIVGDGDPIEPEGAPGSNGGSTDRPGPNGRRCGNGRVEGGELCDGSNLNGETCNSATMGARPAGSLRCTSGCSFDISSCRSSGGIGGGGAGGFNDGGGTGYPGGYAGRPNPGGPNRPVPPLPPTGGFGGFGGTGGFPRPIPPPMGGFGGTAGGPYFTCGNQVCVGAVGGVFPQCCANASRCGIDTSRLNGMLGLPSGCVPQNQPGYFDPSCPAQSSPVGELAGCCKPNGVCGVDWSFFGVGCVDTSGAGGPPRTRCGG